jgi:hypothetical protein
VLRPVQIVIVIVIVIVIEIFIVFVKNFQDLRRYYSRIKYSEPYFRYSYYSMELGLTRTNAT